jgi:hypothetical protein
MGGRPPVTHGGVGHMPRLALWLELAVFANTHGKKIIWKSQNV